MNQKTALIIGAGPAGLTAAYELLDKTDITPIIFEASGEMGGISRTARYHGNRMDLGGHRFFSKSERVMAWWLNILPMQGRRPGMTACWRARWKWRRRSAGARSAPPRCRAARAGPGTGRRGDAGAPAPLAHIIPAQILRLPDFASAATPSPISAPRAWHASCTSYLRARCCPLKNVQSLEDFFINQFGTELYRTFFQDYTEKVWGVPCKEIPADWGAQRVKGLSLSKVIGHALRGMTARKSVTEQQQVETSLIESFIYPKYGPGQLWETVAAKVQQHGAQLHLHAAWSGGDGAGSGHRHRGGRVETGERTVVQGDYFLSTMPVRELIAAFRTPPPERCGTWPRACSIATSSPWACWRNACC